MRGYDRRGSSELHRQSKRGSGGGHDEAEGRVLQIRQADSSEHILQVKTVSHCAGFGDG